MGQVLRLKRASRSASPSWALGAWAKSLAGHPLLGKVPDFVRLLLAFLDCNRSHAPDHFSTLEPSGLAGCRGQEWRRFLLIWPLVSQE